MSPIPDQGEALMRLAERQRAAVAALTTLALAGERPPDADYEEYLAAARLQLEATVAFEERWPGSFELQPVAQPLVQQLSIYADHLAGSGRRAESERCRWEADDLAARFLDAVAAAALARGRALGLAAEGRFHEALSSLERVRATFVEAGETLAAAQTEIELANAYEWLGDLERALGTLDAASSRVESALAGGAPSGDDVAAALQRQFTAIAEGRPSREGEDAMALWRVANELLMARGRVNRLLGDADEAERLFAAARPYHAAMDLTAGIDFHLAVIACARGDLDRAEDLLRRLAPDFERPMLRRRRPALRLLAADVALARRRPAEALGAIADGVDDLETYPDLDLAWKLRWRRGRAAGALADPEGALAAYRAAGAAADELRKAPLGYRLDTTFLRDKLPLFREGIDLAVERRDAPAAIWLAEMVKSRALSATISAPRPAGGAAGDDETRFDELSRTLDALEFALYAGTTDGEADLMGRRAELLAERDAVLERIRIGDPRWRALTQPVPIDVAALSARLGPGRCVLSLYTTPGRVVCGLVDAAGADVAAQALGDDAERALGRFAENLRTRRPDPFLSDLSAETGIGLADLVPPALAGRALDAEVVVVVPHGLLHLVPWAALAVEDGRLFERAAVGVLPNLASLPLLDLEPMPHPVASLIGDPDYSGLRTYQALPEAGPEIDDLAELYGPDLRDPPLTGADATEAGFWARAAAGPEAILHMACHGTLDAEEPLSSGLLLTGSKVDAAEVATRRLGFPEVVLSACSTGWRPQRARGLELAGDDALGLTASFLESGARFLLVSIPQAEDRAARTFCVAWHRHRRGGASPLQAYRAAQREMLAASPDSVWAWAGMTAYGCR